MTKTEMGCVGMQRQMRAVWRCCVLGFVAMCWLVLPAGAQGVGDPQFGTGTAIAAGESTGQMRAMHDRLRRLEETLDTLQRAVYTGAPAPIAPAPLASDVAPQPATGAVMAAETGLVYDRVLALEENVRALTGYYEVMDHKMNMMNKRLDRLVVDLDVRLRTIEDSMQVSSTGQPAASASEAGVQPQGTTPPVTNTDPGAVQVLGTVTQDQLNGVPPTVPDQSTQAATQTASLLPADGNIKEQYDVAMELVRQGRLSDAERAWDEFLAAHPDDVLASNAYYWKAESIYARKDYERAAAVFLSGYQAFPEGRKAPDMLLKLSKSLAALNIHTEACAMLDKLAQEFPNAPEKIKRRANNDAERLQCQVSVTQ